MNPLIELPKLHDIPWWIDALWDYYTSHSSNIVSQAKTMVDAVLWLQELSRWLFEEYSRLYLSWITETVVSQIPEPMKLGVTYWSTVRKNIPYSRENMDKDGFFTWKFLLPFNYPKEENELIGERGLKRLASKYEKLYYAQFEIDNNKQRQSTSLFG